VEVIRLLFVGNKQEDILPNFGKLNRPFNVELADKFGLLNIVDLDLLVVLSLERIAIFIQCQNLTEVGEGV
jgi:hypothetical protein